LKIKREILLGILGVVSLLLFIWGVNYLKGTDLLQRQQIFYVIYPKVDGLIESHPVSVNGVKIGQVNKIGFHRDRTGRVVVECIINPDIDIPVNSQAILRSASLIGGYEIVLQLGDSNMIMQHSDTLTGVIQPSLQDDIAAQLDPFKDQSATILARFDTLLTSLNMVFDNENRTNLSHGIGELNKSLRHIESIAANINKQEQSINKIVGNLTAITDSIAALEIKSVLDQTSKSIETLQQVLSSVNEGEGSLTRLLHDDGLYQNLERSSYELELLLEDIRNNPRKYFNFSVFGK
jgi:phospholipid/cholesterol/gamma-HCH transport system substrate-binding protein